MGAAEPSILAGMEPTRRLAPARAAAWALCLAAGLAASCDQGGPSPADRAPSLGSVRSAPGVSKQVGGRPDGRPRASDLEPTLVSDAATYDTQPTIAAGPDGQPWSVWVANTADGDRLVCTRLGADGEWSQPTAITARAGSYVRPVLAFAGERALCVWTGTSPGASLWMASSADGLSWSDPTPIAPSGRHLNAELASDGAGGVWATWMSLSGASYDILAAHFDGTAWGRPVSVCDDPGNDWDPVVVCTSAGDPVVAWTAFRDADYDVFLRRWDGASFGAEERVTDHAAYDLHASLAVDAADRVWLAWDRVAVGAHGGSGKIVRRDGQVIHDGPDDRSTTTVEVRCFDQGRWRAPAVAPPQLKLGHRLQHCAYPRVECGSDGSLLLAFRAWNFKYASPQTYWWDALVYRYAGERWSRPELLPRSDGYLEELGTVVADGALWVAAQMEHRVTPREDALHPEAGPTSFEFDHHWAAAPQGEAGDVYVTRMPLAGEASAPVLADVESSAAPSALSANYVERSDARYEIEVDGVTYRALFGDTHKHSNISRCSAGRDPSVGDHYRYSHDVCRYDFLVVSDHSGHTSDHNWWRLQQSADLFDAPGFFAALFGYEISNGWPTGHKNVIFAERPARMLRMGLDRATSGPAIWAGLEGERAITIGHTTSGMAGTDWTEHDPRYERLVEVYQPLYGSSEHLGAPRTPDFTDSKRTNAGFVHEALRKGHRLGMIASTDHGLGAAYAVVYATGIGREEVFEALHARRCYGSTVYGALLDFRANGRPMGSELEAEGPVELSVRLRAPLSVERVDVFVDAELERTFEAPVPEADGWVELAWTGAQRAEPTTSYYVRATLAGDELVWSSPIWVDRR